MALEIAKGLNYLHQLDPPLLHRDIKSHNILIGDDEKMKVADFGLSVLQPQTSSSSNNLGKIIGTPSWYLFHS